MNIHQILEELTYDSGELPREAIEAAVLNKNEIIPFLLEILEEANRSLNEVLQHDNYQGHLFAIYLLAQFREKRALPLLLRLVSLPSEIVHDLFGDVVTEDLDRILASLSTDSVEPIFQLIENKQIDEYVRAAGLSALVTLVGCGFKRRNEILHYFSTLFAKLEKVPSFVWSNLVYSCFELYPEELIHEIKLAFDLKLADPTYISLDEINQTLSLPKEDRFFHLYQNAELIEDTVTEMEKWLTV